MNVSITSEGMVVFKLPRHGEMIIVSERADGFCVTGWNYDRGFAWAVGSFTTYTDAIDAARVHYSEELEIAGHVV